MSLPLIECETELDLSEDLKTTSFHEFDQVLPKLKDIHSKYQTEIVHDLTKIHAETEKIVGSLMDI